MIYQCESFLRNIIPYVKKFYIMTVVAINQPGYLPWSGFFKRIMASDVFVFLDDVQYSRGDWDNRNKIRTSEDSMWLTVPILNKSGKLINQVEIDFSNDILNGGFQIKNPNAERTCGCGTSFSA